MAPAASTEFDPTPEELETAGEELRKRFFAGLEQEKTDVEAEFCEADLERLREDNWYCQRFVLHEKGQMDKALAMVKEAFKWRKEFNVHDIKESNLLAEFFEAQGVYPYNTDLEGNPILMLVVKLHKKDAEIQAELRRFLIYWIERLEKEVKDKKMTIIFDCSGAGLSNLDLDVIRFLVTTFKNYYPFLLASIVVFDMPWLFNAAWKIIKSWLPQDAVEKIKFVNKKTIFEHVAKENLPLSMGGTCTYEYTYDRPDGQNQAKTTS